MKTVLLSILTVGLLGSGIGVIYAADTMKEASPTIKERLTIDTILGTLMKKEGQYYFIQTDSGLQKIHVDKSTKLDMVKTGDVVKAYVTDQGHATTLQRDN
ncbi:MAG: hypothetical protein H8K03_21395 [Nitrospira sp.]